MNEQIINVKELDLELIAPNSKNYKNRGSEGNGFKLVVIGKPKTGKSTLIKSILYEKRNMIPVGIFFSSSEKYNHNYEQYVPGTFIFDEYDTEMVQKFKLRQQYAKTYCYNQWAAIVMDDSTSDKRIFNTPLVNELFKNGRHMDMLNIWALQYAIDLPPPIRNSIDGTFILREVSKNTREKLYKNFAGVIPTFALFNVLMDELTNDFMAMYIHNFSSTNKWQDCVYFYKAKKVDKKFKFGCPQYWNYHFHKYNKSYMHSGG